MTNALGPLLQRVPTFHSYVPQRHNLFPPALSQRRELHRSGLSDDTSVDLPVWRGPKSRKFFLLSRSVCARAIVSMWLNYAVI